MENIVTMKKNGTTFTVVLKSAEKAKLSFEDLMKKIISDSAVQLDPAANENEMGIGCTDGEKK